MSRKQKIAILGANASITMLIEKAKDMGFETHVFSRPCGEPGERVADYFYPIPIDHKDEILIKCKSLAIAGVCSITSDFAAPFVNYVARGLKLTCNSEYTEEVARNKYRMRCAFRDAGLYTPDFIQLDSGFSASDIENLDYPVIVKPIDRWSSKGVTRVDGPEKLKEAIYGAISESFIGKAIVESFMDGSEYSAECICFQGERRILAFTKKETTGYPHYIETGHIQPADIPADRQEVATRTILKALEALDIQNGAAHAEFRLLPGGKVGIVEIGARMGGDCIGTDLTPMSTGMDYIRMVIDVACGKAPCFDIVSEARPVAVKYIIDKNDLRTLTQIQKERPEVIIRVADINSNFMNQVVDSNTRHGYYILKLT